MAQVCVLDSAAQFKTPCEKFYNILKTQNHKIPNASHRIHDVKVHEGDWETPGSVKVWKYTLDGKEEVFKERIEVDEANKTLTFVAVGGNVLELYKSLITTMKFENNGSLKLRMEYEKLNDDVPPPHKYLQFVRSFMEDIDANC